MIAWQDLAHAYRAAKGERLDLALARHLGVDPRTVRKWLEGTAVPSDRHAQIAAFLGPFLGSRWLGALGGDAFHVFPRLKGKLVAGCEVTHLAGQMREFSEYVQAVAVSIADGTVTAEEARRIEREWREVELRANALVAWAKKEAGL